MRKEPLLPLELGPSEIQSACDIYVLLCGEQAYFVKGSLA